MNSHNRQSAKKRRRRQPQSPINQGIAIEVSLKLVLSWIIAIAAVGSSIRLVPYHLSQQAKLKELQIQVKETDARVLELRKQLNYNFDPQKTQSLMEQYSSLLAPNKSRIYWLPPEEDE